jgi:hypothetical protein
VLRGEDLDGVVDGQRGADGVRPRAGRRTAALPSMDISSPVASLTTIR